MVFDPDEYRKRLYEDDEVEYTYHEDRPLPAVRSGGNEPADRQAEESLNAAATASGYSGYDSDGINYSKDMFQDDTADNMTDFIHRLRLTPRVQKKLAEMYMIFSSKDFVLTWTNGAMLKDTLDRVKLELLEFKNTLIGPDSDSLLFNDYDLAMETFISRLRTRYSRSYEGFERRAVVSQIQITQDMTRLGEQHQEPASGLRKLGNSMPFGR